jgi:hypothetical protein
MKPYETLTNYPKKNTGSNPGHSFETRTCCEGRQRLHQGLGGLGRDANEVGTEAKTPSGKRLQKTMVGGFNHF